MTCERCGKTVASNLLYCEFCGERRFKAKIRLVDGAGNDNTLYLFAETYHIGREKSCEIFIDDKSVSRRHARIVYDGSNFLIEDLNSKNGVLVNDEKIQSVVLQNLDCIQIGPASMYFYYPDGEFPEEKIYSKTAEFVQATLLKITREIQSKNMLDEVLNAVMDGIMAVTHAKAASLWMPDENKNLELRLTRNLKLLGEGDRLFQQRRKQALRLMNQGAYYLVAPTGQSYYLENLHSGIDSAYRKLGVPLRSLKFPGSARGKERNVLGVLILETAPSGRKLDARGIGLLESLVSQAVIAVENTYLYNEALAKRKIDNELELAREIQGRLRPRELVKIPHLDMAAYSRPRNVVGGDYYDVQKVRDEGLAVVVGDVTGKGVGAALLMSSLQGSLRAQLSYETNPEQILHNINQLFRESSTEKIFATFFFGIYDYRTGDLTYLNAGHNPPIVYRTSGGEDLLKSSGPPLGVVEKTPVQRRTIRLATNEVILLYTDGLTDAMNEEMKALGFTTVRKFTRSYLNQHPAASAKEILDAILKHVDAHVQKQPQHDDLTILILKRTA